MPGASKCASSIPNYHLDTRARFFSPTKLFSRGTRNLLAYETILRPSSGFYVTVKFGDVQRIVQFRQRLRPIRIVGYSRDTLKDDDSFARTKLRSTDYPADFSLDPASALVFFRLHDALHANDNHGCTRAILRCLLDDVASPAQAGIRIYIYNSGKGEARASFPPCRI